jgi:Beta-propeller repeat/Abnormal spindle-like microcephaly-assoc'd, ASPM-SPD-2-Hydin
MRSRSLSWMLFSLMVLVYPVRHSSAQTSPLGATVQGPRTYKKYAALPLTFEPNQGQTNSQVKFISRGKGYTAFLTAGGIVLSLHPNQPAPVRQVSNVAAANPSQRLLNTTLQFKLLGAAQNPTVIGEDTQPGTVSYFIGKDPTKWHVNVPTYARVRYKNVYPGIDLVYYGNPQQLEYDFAISPGADPGQIQFEIAGASQISLDASGNLVLETGGGELHFQSPVVYQESNGLLVPVSGNYVVNGSNHIEFYIAQHDPAKPLVIDPTLVYSTYLGGAGDDQPTGIVVDGTGSVYVEGYTDSADFLLTTLGSPSTETDHVFVAKLDPTGSSLIYADYIGGSSGDYGVGLALDSANNVYVTGSTTSSDFPMVNAYQAVEPGSYNGFVTKISADGSSLVYSTYLGGSGFDQPAGVAVDGLGEAYIAGSTTSQDFPVVNAYQNAALANQGGLYGTYGFVTKFTADGSSLTYSTYLAGNLNVAQNCGSPCWPSPYTTISAVALDGNAGAYVAGTTNTSNFPATSGAYLTSNSTQPDATIGFVSKFASAGSLDYSTYLYGTSGNPIGIGAITVDGSGSAYVAGTVSSDGTFPITSTSICDPGVYGPACSYAFVSKFDPTAATLLYSTFLGPNNYASPESIALDASNNAYILATTESGTFGTSNGIEGYSSGWDMLLVELNASATTEVFATYLGGSGDEFASGMALDANGNIYVTGSTDSSDFPVTQGAFQNLLGGNTDGVIMKIGSNSVPAVSLTPSALQYASLQVGSTSAAQTVLLRNLGSSPLSISLISTTGDFAETNTCGTSVPAAGTCTFSIVFAPTAAGIRSGTVVIQDNAAGSPHLINLSGSATGLPATLSPASLTFSSQLVGTPSAAQSATLSNGGSGVLTVANIQATGDFAQTNNCPAQLLGGASCTINVTFSPTAAGARSGALTVSDDAGGSPQTENLTGNGLDFSLTNASGSETVKAGSVANYNLTVSPLGGSFTSAVNLTCTGLPSQTSCSLLPNNVTPGASSATSTLLITTTASSAQALPLRPLRATPVYAVWIQLQATGLLGIMLVVPKAATRKWRVLMLLALLMIALIVMTACAGGTGIAPVTQTGTAPGTYTITVTGTSGSLQHSLPVTLIVQ